jgi:nucleoside-diphosphate-sugar epimerase
MRFTIFGGRGFIGSHLVRYLTAHGNECIAPERGDHAIVTQDLGHVIWAIGVTADFRRRPIDTVQAHVAAPIDILQRGRFDSFLYLSSTRIYAGAVNALEETKFSVDPTSLSDLYNLSKLTGEALCHCSGRPNVRVARLSNVYGGDFESENFLTTIIRDAVEKQEVMFDLSEESSKDYVSIEDVVPALVKIASIGRQQTYNVASGSNTTNRQIAETLRSLTGCSVHFAPTAPSVVFPPIPIQRIREEFKLEPRRLPEELPALVRAFSSAIAR